KHTVSALLPRARDHAVPRSAAKGSPREGTVAQEHRMSSRTFSPSVHRPKLPGPLLVCLGLFFSLGAADPAGAQWGTLLPAHAGDVHGVAFSPDGRCLATAGHDGTVILWDFTGGRFPRATRRHVLKGHADWVLCVAFSPDGKTLATGGKDRTI